jgi:tetratricopeptide (TPR) repeat protein
VSGELLTAAMIVRDEEPHLADCLRSLEGVVDDVVVVDTGSVDRSLEIARSLGARAVELPWSGDFSRARNLSLDLAEGRWILYIDADERLRPVARDTVEALLTEPDEVAFRLLLRPFTHFTPYREYRLWRNDPRIRFEGTIHEKVVPTIHKVAADEGRPIGSCDLELHHVGYDGDQSRKHARNLPLLRAQLASEPDNVFNWWHLGKVLLALGETAEAEQAFLRGVELTRRGLGGPHGGQAYAELALLRQERGDDVDELVDEALQRHPDNWRLVWIKAQLAIDAGDPASALPLLERLTAVDVSTLPDQDVAYDERLFGSFAYESRGVCLFRLGRYADATAAFAQAEGCEPHRIDHRVRRQLAESRARASA